MDSDLRFSPPMVAVLAARVRAMVQGLGVVHLQEPRKPHDLWRYVDRFSANFPARPKNLVERPPMQKDVIVITGTTGGFGCDVLEHLLRDDKVETVYALNRPGTRAMERQYAQFGERGLDVSLLSLPKFKMVEAKAHLPGLGMSATLLDEVRHLR